MAILEILQADSTQEPGVLAEQIGLNTIACWWRIQKLQEEGILRRRMALLDSARLNVGVTVFVSIKTNHTAPCGWKLSMSGYLRWGSQCALSDGG